MFLYLSSFGVDLEDFRKWYIGLLIKMQENNESIAG